MAEIIANRYYNVNSELRVPFRSGLLCNNAMDSKEIRRANMEALLGHGGTLEALADKVGTSSRVLSQIRNRTRNMGDRLARQFEAKLRLPRGSMDVMDGGIKRHAGTLSIVGGKSDKERTVNPDVMQKAYLAVEYAVRDAKKVLSPEQKWRIFEVLCSVGNASNVDADTVKAMLKLVA